VSSSHCRRRVRQREGVSVVFSSSQRPSFARQSPPPPHLDDEGVVSSSAMILFAFSASSNPSQCLVRCEEGGVAVVALEEAARSKAAEVSVCSTSLSARSHTHITRSEHARFTLRVWRRTYQRLFVTLTVVAVMS
jgi:hypothetical protein